MKEQVLEKSHKKTGRRRRVRPYGLQFGMTITYIKISLGVIFTLQIFRLLLFIPLKESINDLIVPFFVSISSLIIVPLIGGIFGYAASRSLIRRMQILVIATTQCAQGNYEQHVPVHEGDEIGHLEEHFNLMADKLAENTKQLRLLTEQNARLAERTRIARDLHDSVKQQVFAIGMQAGATISLLETDTEAARQHLQEIDEQVYRVQLELSALIQELRPSHLQEKSLAIALREYVTTWSRRQGIETECSIQVENLPEELEDALWRVVQEALSNVARHSKASQVKVHLEEKDGQVELKVSDNGCGFDLYGIKMGVGLVSIQERVEARGGKVEMRSQPGGGTEIHIKCFYKQEEDKRQKVEVIG